MTDPTPAAGAPEPRGLREALTRLLNDGADEGWTSAYTADEILALIESRSTSREAAPGVSVSVVMPSGHTHTLSHVTDYDAPQAWDCGTVRIKVEAGHLVTVEPIDRRDATSQKAGLDALAAMLDDELRRVEAGIATPATITRARETYARLAAARPAPNA